MQRLRQGFWKTITVLEGYENYPISIFGNVMSLNYKNKGYAQVLTPSFNDKGYLQVELSINGKPKMKKIHQLVALAWLENPHNYPQVNHIKGKEKYNNHVSNLEWCSNQQNMTHAKEHGLIAKGEKIGSAKITEAIVIEIFRLYNVEKWTQQRIADHFGISQNQVSDILNRESWSHVEIDEKYLKKPLQIRLKRQMALL
jgi:predicted XRE-type DNA-binding protein